ncbi:hypothetical protein [Parasphingorhabdus sp.]|uniref:hypothetical protein n=1 Tax=Parasphingorhabdus sp. TaxID=2709688 RepID=UPI003265BF52
MKPTILLLPMVSLFMGGCGETVEKPAETVEKLGDYTALGTEPGWLVEVKDDQIVHTTQSGENEFTLPVSRMKKTATGWEIKGFSDRHNITLTVTSEKACNDGMSDREYADTVRVAVSEGGYLDGCGGDIISGSEAP